MAAIALTDWLRQNGWDDVFLDLDPERGIVAGERWERALSEAAQRCEAVIFLVSPAWLASAWCRREFHLAQRLNKRVFGVLIADLPVADLPADLTDTWQLVGLAAGNDHVMLRVVDPRSGHEAHVTFSTGGLQRLRAGLERAGLDPRFFAWPPGNDPHRAPYRGLRPLEADDAGIFFGREAAILQGLDRLRGLREMASPRLMVILGASGAGKSSFLRAGLLPRLQRDDRNFLVLPVVRPDRAVLSGETGLVEALVTAFRQAGQARPRAELRALVSEGGAALRRVLRDFAALQRLPSAGADGPGLPPTVVLSVDQAEELFGVEGWAESQAFLSLVREIADADDPAVIVIFTIRSDAYAPLQDAAALSGLRQDPFSLPPLPRGTYAAVIEGPARRFASAGRKLEVEPALVDALLTDIEAGGGKDALPLLAFALERLFHDYGDSGALQLQAYEALGRIRGAIDAAVARAMAAADADPRIPADPGARRQLVRRGLIPWLAGIDPETGAPRRRVARWDEIPEEARPLIGHLVDARLLATDLDRETGARTLEPAHEALLRQWGLLQGWLEEAFADLTLAEGVKRAARDWLANGQDAGWLSHAAGRLEDAEGLRTRAGMAGFLNAGDEAYLAACRRAEDTRRDHELRQASDLAEARGRTALEQMRVVRRTRVGLAVAVALSVIAGVLAWWGFDRAADAALQAGAAHEAQTEAQDTALRAEAARGQAQQMAARLAGPLVDAGRADLALTLSAGLITSQNDPVDPALDAVLRRGMAEAHRPQEFAVSGNAFAHAISPDGHRLAVGTAGDETSSGWVHLFTLPDMQETARFRAQPDAVSSLNFSPNGKGLVVAGSQRASVWDVETGERLFELARPDAGGWTRTALFTPDGRQIVVSTNQNRAEVHDGETGALLQVLESATYDEMIAAFEAAGGRTGGFGATDPILRAVASATFDLSGGAIELALSSDGTQAALTGPSNPDGSVRLFDIASGRQTQVLAAGAEGVKSTGGVLGFRQLAHFTPDGARFVSGISGDALRIWRLSDGKLEAELPLGDPVEIAFGGGGQLLMIALDEGAVQVLCVDDPQRGLSFMAHDGRVESVTTSDAAGLFVTTGKDGFIKVWPLPDAEALCLAENRRQPAASARMQPLRAYRGPRGAIHKATVLPDAARVLSLSQDGILRAFPLAIDARLHLPAAEAGGLIGLEIAADTPPPIWSAEGEAVFVHGAFSELQAWSAETGREVPILRDASAVAADFRSGRTTMFSNIDEPWLWNAPEGLAAEGASFTALDVNLGYVPEQGIAADGSRIAVPENAFAGESDATGYILLDGNGEAEIARLHAAEGAVERIAFAPDGTRIVGLVQGPGAAFLKRWDALTGKPVGQAVPLPPLGYTGFSLSDGAAAATLGSGEAADLVRVQWHPDGTAAVDRLPPAMGTAGNAVHVALSADGAFALAGHSIGNVSLYLLHRPRAAVGVQTGSGGVIALHMSANGRLGAALSGDGTLAIFETDSGREVRRIRPWGEVLLTSGSLRFHPRGTSVVACAAGQGCAVIDTGPPSRWSDGLVPLVRPAARPPGLVGERLFAQDGANVLVHGTGESVLGWNLSTGARRVLPGGIRFIATGPDSQVYAYDEKGLPVPLPPPGGAKPDARPPAPPEDSEQGTFGSKNPFDDFWFDMSPAAGRALYQRGAALVDSDFGPVDTSFLAIEAAGAEADALRDAPARLFLFDPDARKTIAELATDGRQIEMAAFSEDGTRAFALLAGQDDEHRAIAVWDATTGRRLALQDAIAWESYRSVLYPSAAGTRFLVGAPGAEALPRVIALADPVLADGPHPVPAPASGAPMTAFGLSGDGMSAILGHEDGTFAFLPALDETIVEIDSRLSTITAVHLSPDGRVALVQGPEGRFALIDTRQAQIIRRDTTIRPLTVVLFAPSSHQVLLCEDDGQCQMIDDFHPESSRLSAHAILTGFAAAPFGTITPEDRRLYGLP